MKRTALALALMMGLIVITVIGCKKTDSGSTSTRPPSTPENEFTLQTTLSQNASDQTEIQSDEDLIIGDVQKAIFAANNFNGAQSTSYDTKTLPNAVIDLRASKTNKLITIGYVSDSAINGVSKNGTITIQLTKGANWNTAGATISESDSVKITYNGISRVHQSNRTITNILGGKRDSVSKYSSYVYSVHSYGVVNFPDNTTCNYWITRKNTLSNSSSFATLPVIFSSNGDTTINGDVCTMGGTSRTKTKFRVKDSQTYATSLLCGYSRPFLGIRSFIAGDTVKITFGVDASGNQSGSDTTACGSIYGYKIEWTKLNGLSGSRVFSY